MATATPAPPSHPQLAVSAAIFRDDKILLVRRAQIAGQGLLFAARRPGRIRRNRCITALHREVDEETGAQNRHRRPRRVARGAAGNRRRRALSDHVLRGTLELRRAGPERRTRRFQVARADALGDLKLTAGLRRSSSPRAACSGPEAPLAERFGPAAPCFQPIEKAYHGDPGPIHVKASSGRLSSCLGVPSRPGAGPGRGRAVRRRPAAAGRDPRHPALSARHLRQQ